MNLFREGLDKMKIIWTPGELAKLQAAVDAAGISVSESVRRIYPHDCSTCQSKENGFGCAQCRYNDGWRPKP
jgi:hypothetical protein